MQRIRRRSSIWAHALFLSAAALLTTIDQADAQRAVRGGTHQSIHSTTANRNANRNVDRDVNRNVNRDIDIHHDIDIDVDHDWDGDHHPIAAGIAFGTAAAVTAAAIGSIFYSLPPACAPRPYGAMTYYYCGGVWYQPQYAGTSVTYVVVQTPG